MSEVVLKLHVTLCYDFDTRYFGCFVTLFRCIFDIFPSILDNPDFVKYCVKPYILHTLCIFSKLTLQYRYFNVDSIKLWDWFVFLIYIVKLFCNIN